MVPIHDSDIAEERWAQAEWQHYELWEKIEIKLRRRRNFWVAATIGVFLLLSSIPILVDHWPRWTSLRAARALGDQINEVKRLAGTEDQAFRLDFAADHRLSYTITRVKSCSEPISSGVIQRTGSLLAANLLGDYVLLSPQQGRELGIPGLVESFCYDPLVGSSQTHGEQSLAGFGIIPVKDLPVKDLTEQRQNRISILIFKGPSAEVSFE